MADDDVGIYLRRQGIPQGGITPGAGIFLDPTGALDTTAFTNWFSGLTPVNQDMINASIANMNNAGPAATPAGTTPPGPGTATPQIGVPPGVNNAIAAFGAGPPQLGVSPPTGQGGASSPADIPGSNAGVNNAIAAFGAGPPTPAATGLPSVPFVSSDQLPGTSTPAPAPGGGIPVLANPAQSAASSLTPDQQASIDAMLQPGKQWAVGGIGGGIGL